MGEASPRAIALVIERGTLERGKLRVFPLTLCLLPLWNVDMMCWGSSNLSVFEMIATGWQNRKTLCSSPLLGTPESPLSAGQPLKKKPRTCQERPSTTEDIEKEPQ